MNSSKAAVGTKGDSLDHSIGGDWLFDAWAKSPDDWICWQGSLQHILDQDQHFIPIKAVCSLETEIV